MFYDIAGSNRGMLLPLLLMVTIPGCVYIINKEPMETVAKAPCNIEFSTPPIPGVPVLSQADLKDHNRSDTILVDKIKELRDYATNLQKSYKEHSQIVTELCSKS